MGLMSARTGAKYADTKKEKTSVVEENRLVPFVSIGWLDCQGALGRS